MRTFFLLLLAIYVSVVNAQEIEVGCMSIDAVFDACVAMQESIEQNDTAALVGAADRLKNSETTSFTSLRCKDDIIYPLKGHFVFNEVFVDSLTTGHDAYSNSDSINCTSTCRGQTSDGSIFTKTCLVKVGKSTKYVFTSRGRQELGIIAEPDGRIYVRVHVTNRSGMDVRYNDDKNAVNGVRRYRKAFDLPVNQRNTVELEVINKGRKDTSFVVISN